MHRVFSWATRAAGLAWPAAPAWRRPAASNRRASRQRDNMAPALNAEKGLLALAAAAACCAGCVDAVPTASGSGDTVAATLFACGSHNDVSADTIQIIHVFDAAKSVCCDELHEQCDDSSSTLPTPAARPAVPGSRVSWRIVCTCLCRRRFPRDGIQATA